MRIFHILDHSIPLHSGYTFRTLSILREQQALGWETFHLTGSKQGSNLPLEEEVDGWRFYRTPEATGFMSKLPVMNQLAMMEGLTRRLSEVVKIRKPDVLHAHSPVLNAIPALRVGRSMGIPVLYEVRAFWEDAAVDHGTNREGDLRYRLIRVLESYALRKADAVTTICDGLRNDILGRGIPSEKVTVIPNAVNISDFTMEEACDRSLAKEIGLEGSPVIGFIGSFYAYEGLNILFQALPKILLHHPNVRILLVGGGPQEQELKSLAAQLGVTNRVVFAGRVPHNQIQRYYNLFDLMIYPRLKKRVTDLVTPLKPLEAMAQGRLLIASDVGGHLELIRDGETGILFEAGNADALADKVTQLLSNRDRWPYLRAAARKFVETEKNWTASVAHYKAIYDRLTEQETSK